MVEDALRSAFKAEHKMEQLMESVSDGANDPADKEIQEIKQFAEQTAIITAKAAETWGKEAFNKAKEITEDIEL